MLAARSIGSRGVLPGIGARRIGLAVLLCLVAACQRQPHLEVSARILAPAIRECSGIVASRHHAGVFWVHNDSGNAPQLFAIDDAGELLCTVQVQGVGNIDWEDVTIDDGGNLYVGEFGNNRNERRNLQVLVVREPDPFACQGGSTQVTVQRRIPFRFPEQAGFPDAQHMNFDVEALFWLDGALYVFTKHRSDNDSVLYRLPSGDARDAERLGVFDAGGMVTAAAVSPDGRRLLVLTYDFLHEFTLQPGRPLLEGPHRRLLLEARQSEAVEFDGDVAVVVNEQREMYRIPLDPWRDTWLPEVPRAKAASVADTAPQDVAWEAIASLPLTAEYEEGRLPPLGPPALRLARSATALYLQVRYGPAGLPDDVDGALLLVSVGADAGRRARVARPDDTGLVVTRSQGACRLHRTGPDPSDSSRAILQEYGGTLSLRLPLAPTLEEATILRVNVIVRRPGDGRLHEWAWGSTSSTRPDENALLWGRLERRDGR